ncbi:MAG: CheR family methyltransferase, partial [Pelovirga sp.]
MKDLLSHLPAETGIALVLLQHLKAEYDSNLPGLLGKATSLPVAMAEDNTPVKPNQVYILPPGQIMEIKNRHLHLSPRTAQAGRFRPIDHFFTSLAKDCKEEALVVILSGSGSDGSAGLRDIKAEGGIVLAQDEASAEFPEMPRHAMQTGLVDFTLSPEQIAAKLEELCRHPHLRRAAMVSEGDTETLKPETFSPILKCLQKAGVDFTQYKQSTVGRRITRRMALHRIEKPEKYADFISEHPEEITALKEDMLIKVTSFFRDPEVFEVLKQEVFPQIISKKEDSQSVRIWVPGCATGEEAYSIAISLLDFMDEKGLNLPMQIFGTDLSEAAINKARKGIYSATEVNSISADQLSRYFSKSESDYQIKKSLREHCIFAQQDFTRDPPFSRIDLISCRNVLIYLGPELQKKVMSIFHYALAPEGFLLLGSSESIGQFDSLFRSLDKKQRIYTKIKKAKKEPLSFIPKHPPVHAGESNNKKNEAVQPEEAMDVQSETDRILLQKYQPSAVAVDSSMNILHFRGETSLFLEHLPGKASLNLIKMIKNSLRMDLRTLIHRAQQEKTSQRKSNLQLLSADGPHTISLEVTPFSAGNTEECFLIQFEQKPEDQTLSTTMPEAGDDTSPSEIERLKHDLLASHEYAQSLIEEKETALEELKAANEEILSSNEELQSINEELETAKEELESSNEELVTVNQELQGRNEELSRSHDDLQNLILSAEIPFIVVNRDLHIQRCSPRAEAIFNVRTDDIGRPLGEIRPTFEVAGLEELIHDVIESDRSVEREIPDRSGRWNLLRVRPYTTGEQEISGAVITLIDIDRLKRSHEEIEKAHKHALRIVDTIKEPLLVLSPDLHILTANPSFYERFQVRPQETEGQLIYQLGAGQWDHQELRTLLEEILPKSAKMDNFLVQFDFPRLGPRSMLLSARKMS